MALVFFFFFFFFIVGENFQHQLKHVIIYLSQLLFNKDKQKPQIKDEKIILISE